MTQADAVPARLPAFDHLMVRVRDCEPVADALAAAGLTVTPRSAFAGLSNRLVCFPSAVPGACAFLEFIAVEDPGAVPPPVAAFLPAENGPFAVTVAVADAMAVADRLAAAGHAAAAQRISRRWVLPDGEALEVELSVCIAPAATAPLRWAAAQHRTPEHYLRSDFTRHGNGASALVAAVAAVADPAGWGRRLSRAWGLPLQGGDGLAILGAGEPEVRAMPPAAARRAFPGAPLPEGDGIFAACIRVPDLRPLEAVRPQAGLTRLPATPGAVSFHLTAAGLVLRFEAGPRA